MTKHAVQIVIVGGGISGLWILNRLRNAGYDAWLLEGNALGGEQTMASQGMIHGGLKYAIGGFTTPASETIAAMPRVWKECLAGEGSVNLLGLDCLSDDYYLFSDGALSSKLTGFFAKKTLKARISEMNEVDFPEVFQSSQFKGVLYRLEDIVLDIPSLIKKLAEPYRDYILHKDPVVINNEGNVDGLLLNNGERLTADKYIFAAGSGNERLIANTPLSTIKMQRRPLQQIMLKGKLPSLYAHAVSLKTTTKPRVTFTTHSFSTEESIWYLGGSIAEQGVGMSSAALIDKAKQEIKSLLPWVDISTVEWATLNVDRAEPAQENKLRPDFPFVESSANCTVCWPTKLTLAPLLADLVLDNIELKPVNKMDMTSKLFHLPKPPYAKTPWERAFD